VAFFEDLREKSFVVLKNETKLNLLACCVDTQNAVSGKTRGDKHLSKHRLEFHSD
jgi:hypothetical protein